MIFGDLKLWELADVLREVRLSWEQLSALLGITGLAVTATNAGRLELLLSCDRDLRLKLHVTEFVYRIGMCLGCYCSVFVSVIVFVCQM